MVSKTWWWFRGLIADDGGSHYLTLCQRCHRRGLTHVHWTSLWRCWRFLPFVLPAHRGFN
jgi:hypothetical protein